MSCTKSFQPSRVYRTPKRLLQSSTKNKIKRWLRYLPFLRYGVNNTLCLPPHGFIDINCCGKSSLSETSEVASGKVESFFSNSVPSYFGLKGSQGSAWILFLLIMLYYSLFQTMGSGKLTTIHKHYTEYRCKIKSDISGALSKASGIS